MTDIHPVTWTPVVSEGKVLPSMLQVGVKPHWEQSLPTSGGLEPVALMETVMSEFTLQVPNSQGQLQ